MTGPGPRRAGCALWGTLVVLQGFLGAPASAHGGEDHGAPPAAPAADGSTHSVEASNERFEVVIRHPMQPAGAGPQQFVALVSDWQSNAPVEGATLDAVLTLGSYGDVRIPFAPTRSPGVYAAHVAPPADGVWTLQLTVVQGSAVGSFTIPGIDIGARVDEHADHAAEASMGVSAATVGGLLGGTLLFVALLVWLARRRAPAAGMLIIVSIAAAGARAHGGDDHAAPAAPPASTAGARAPGRIFLGKESQFLLGVRTEVARTEALAERVLVSGVVSAPPERHAAVLMPQSGRVLPPGGGFPQLGARVKRGQLLGIADGVITSSERASFLAGEAQARADIASASARLEAARSALARLESLAGVSSAQQIEQARVQVLTAQADAEAGQAKLAAFTTSERGGARFELRAPLDGVLADLSVSPGDVQSQGTRVFLVVDPSVLTVEAKVPEHELERLRASRDAVVTVDAFPARPIPAALIAEGQLIDPVTRTAKVLFEVNNSDGLLKLGMFARVQIGTGAAATERVAVPDAAVLDVDGRRVIYVHVAPEEFEAREVELGRRDGARVEVLTGVSAGERVVVVGAYSLRGAAR